MEIRISIVGLGCRGKLWKICWEELIVWWMKYPPMASHWTIVQIPLQSSKGTAALGALQKLVWDSKVTCTGNVLLKFQNDTKMPIIVINTKKWFVARLWWEKLWLHQCTSRSTNSWKSSLNTTYIILACSSFSATYSRISPIHFKNINPVGYYTAKCIKNTGFKLFAH